MLVGVGGSRLDDNHFALRGWAELEIVVEQFGFAETFRSFQKFKKIKSKIVLKFM